MEVRFVSVFAVGSNKNLLSESDSGANSAIENRIINKAFNRLT